MSEIKKIEELNPASRSVDLLVKVLEVNPPREVSTKDGSQHRVAEVLVGDSTGCVLMSLWDSDIEKVQAGQSFWIRNGYVSLFRGNIRLNTGRYGTIEPSEEDVAANTENNISNRSYDQKIPKFRPLFHDDSRRGRRRR
ncbi:MAG: single-stranded DNA-binding protein [Candidatus Verstraetearchaeota archaeon]|nr:single-stranded DNA-binding protein [Candidatus Verstraetearchaeota archaeon]